MLSRLRNSVLLEYILPNNRNIYSTFVVINLMIIFTASAPAVRHFEEQLRVLSFSSFLAIVFVLSIKFNG